MRRRCEIPASYNCPFKDPRVSAALFIAETLVSVDIRPRKLRKKKIYNERRIAALNAALSRPSESFRSSPALKGRMQDPFKGDPRCERR